MEIQVMESKKAQKSWLWTGMVFVALVVLGTAAAVDASVPAYAGPSWRNGLGTTLEQWSFGDGSVTPSPDPLTLHNTYGTPELWVGSRATYYDSIDSYKGVWTPGTDEIDIQIPNTDNTGSNTYKNIWIEITWKAAGLTVRPHLPSNPMVLVDPDGGYDAMNFTRSDTLINDSGWYRTIVMVDIWPNPISEWIAIKGDIYIDEITIDTRCVPEPATFGLLIGGAFVALRRKLKKS
jgi:hypothetical protein